MSLCRLIRFGKCIGTRLSAQATTNSRDATINPCIDASQGLPTKLLSITKNVDENKHYNYGEKKDKEYHTSQSCILLDPVHWAGFGMVISFKLQDKLWPKEHGCQGKFTLAQLLSSYRKEFNYLRNELFCFLSFKQLYQLKTHVKSPKALEANKDHATTLQETEAFFNDASVELQQPTAGSVFGPALAILEGHIRNKRAVEEVKTDITESFKHFQLAAKKGSPSAHFNLGICYQKGFGTSTNMKKAIHHYTLASRAGHREATYNLGVHYFHQDSTKQKDLGYELIYAASFLGVTQAEVDVGYHYYEDGNLEQAAKYFNLAAEKKNPAGQCYMGLFYLNGYGVEVNVQKALELLTLSAESQHPNALYCLALLYEKGASDIPIDTDKSHQFMVKAANLGSEEARQYLKEKETLRKKTLSDQKLAFSFSAPNLQLLDEQKPKTIDVSEYLNILHPRIFQKKNEFTKKDTLPRVPLVF